MAEKAGRERIGSEAWDKMSEPERERQCKCHLGDCHDHLRNIIIKAMATAATDYLKVKLGDSLDEFTSFDRMSVDAMDVIRATCKEIHPNGEYAKGKGREATATRKRDHPSELWLPIYDPGRSRMDAAFDGSVPLYMDRMIILSFLHPLVNGPTSKDNILEKFLWRVLSCTEMVALLRVNTLWQTILTEPLRWLTGKSSALDDWSMVNSNDLLDKTYDLMMKVAVDGSALLDPTIDPFAEIASKQQKFAEHRLAQQTKTIAAPDGTVHHVHARTLQEARSPTSAGDKESTPMAVELAQVMANAALVAMRDSKRAIADKLKSQGDASAEERDAKQTRVHEATAGAHVTNARVESHFGTADHRMRTYRSCTAENISGMVQQAYNHDFDMPRNVVSDRRKRKAGAPEPEQRGGFFWSEQLTDELRASLVAAVRKEAEHARSEGRKALAEHDAAKLARREERLVMALNAAVDYYAYGQELFEAYSVPNPQGAKDAKAVDAALKDKPEVQQLQYLRFQIDMRVIGLGWNQFKTAWSSKSDPTVGTVKHLRDLLVEQILPHERAEIRLKQVPSEAAPPQFTAKDVGQLGAANADALAIQSKALFSVDELKAKAEAAVARREAAGISDSVERMQQPDAPLFNQELVGKQVLMLVAIRNTPSRAAASRTLPLRAPPSRCRLAHCHLVRLACGRHLT